MLTNALFTAILVAIISTELYRYLSKVSWLTIKLPDGVPPAVSRSFAKLLPGVITLFAMGTIGILVKKFSGGLFINDLLSTYLAKPLTGVADSFAGTIVVALFVHILWIFGLPIVLNPMYAIPFVLAPVLCAALSYFAISSGIVHPVIMAKIPWVTPPILGGLMATGHWTGGVLAAVNLLISILIYLPFVVAETRMEKKKLER